MDNQPIKPDSIALNHDAMIILTQSYESKHVIRVVDAHTKREVDKAILADRAHRPAVAGSVDTPEFRAVLIECQHNITRADKWGPLIAHINDLLERSEKLAPAASSGEAVGEVVLCEDYGFTVRWAKTAPLTGTKLYTNPAPKASSTPEAAQTKQEGTK